MLFMISAFIRCLFYFKHGPEENRSNEISGTVMFGVLSAIFIGTYIGVVVKGYWELLLFMLPFEFLYVFLQVKGGVI